MICLQEKEDYDQVVVQMKSVESETVGDGKKK